MTRINLVDPVHLADQHLMAEYRELPMVMAALKRSLRSKNGLPEIGKMYTLNSGHVKFFYNKGAFLRRRYALLVMELVARDYALSERPSADFSVFRENGLDNDWAPSKQEIAINVERINARMLQRPGWYKYYGKPIHDPNWFLRMEE